MSDNTVANISSQTLKGTVGATASSNDGTAGNDKKRGQSREGDQTQIGAKELSQAHETLAIENNIP